MTSFVLCIVDKQLAIIDDPSQLAIIGTLTLRTYQYIFFVFLLVCCICFRLLKHISDDDATWISELEMFYFMLSMYLSSWWWWVHGCMDETSAYYNLCHECAIS